MDGSPEWLDNLLAHVEAVRAPCPRLAELTTQWAALTAEWLKAERQMGGPDRQTAAWLSQTGVPDLVHALGRAAKEPALARWLEDSVPQFGMGIFMAPLRDHEEQGIWIVDFPSSVITLVRELDREG